MQNTFEPNPRNKGIYLLPNLFTTAALFAGFYSIVAAMKGLYGTAAITVFIAMIMDALDGRVARLTNTQTEFGVQYDSLSDMVSFGLAPALIAYHWGLAGLGKFGWLVAFAYAACTALRLARFNTQAEKADKRYFQGLACPAAAGLVAGMIWLGNEYEIEGASVSILVVLITVLVAALMVSNFRYYSFKGIDFKGKVPFVSILVVVLIFVAISLNPSLILFAIFFVYCLSGPIATLWQIKEKRKLKRLLHDQQPQHEERLRRPDDE
jgi:CDP-diacylglycerol---serine O-phosphatidyltransferase